jgi:hypothetical protein
MVDGGADAFVTDPGAWADPGLAAPLIAPGLQAETARRLLSSPRLAARASRLLLQRLGEGDPAMLEPADRALAAAGGEILEMVAACAGAVWHTRRVRALVLGADIARLCARLGDDTRRAALRHAALAPAEAWAVGANGRSPDEADGLADDIERDGARCLAAWIDSLPDWAASRVRLKWRLGPAFAAPSFDTDHVAAEDAGRACAVRIVRVLSAEALVA